MDRNGYYGGESASLNLNQMYERFAAGHKVPEALGSSRDYNIDLIPKFLMGCGQLVDILVHSDVAKYLDFKVIDGSYVKASGKVSKVPTTPMEAMSSSLMGFFQKRHVKNFLEYVGHYDEEDPKTHKRMDLRKVTMQELFNKYDCDANSADFLGHAMALHHRDDYLKQPALETVHRLKLYAHSLSRYEKSPYLYPLYGLGELPGAFSRLAAVHGGTYMLNKKIDAIVYDDEGKVCGVTSEGETARAKIVVGDPSYFPDKVKEARKIVRTYCILDHPIPRTKDADSAQIILPQKQIGRHHDIYVSCLNFTHHVAPKGKYIVIVSSVVETNNPEKELEAGLQLLGPILVKFTQISTYYEPLSDGKKENVYISKSFDPSTHFESTVDDVLDLYQRITGGPLVLKKKAADEEEQQ